MSAVIVRWKNRIQKPNHRDNTKQIPADTNEYKQIKSANQTLEKLHEENVLLRERFLKLEETAMKMCQQWVCDEKVHLLRRIEELETKNYHLSQDYHSYQAQCDKCIQAITDLIMKAIGMQESYLNKETLLPIQPEWLRKRLLVEEEEDYNDETRNLKLFGNYHNSSFVTDKTDLHITESQSSIYSVNRSNLNHTHTTKVSSTGLKNDLCFCHVDNNNDNKTTPIHKRKVYLNSFKTIDNNSSPQPTVNTLLFQNKQTISSPSQRVSQRPLSSPASLHRSQTYVLQQYNNNISSPSRKEKIKTSTSPVMEQIVDRMMSTTTTSSKKFPISDQQQHSPVVNKPSSIIYSNHERLNNTNFVSRAQITFNTDPVANKTINSNTRTPQNTYYQPSPNRNQVNRNTNQKIPFRPTNSVYKNAAPTPVVQNFPILNSRPSTLKQSPRTNSDRQNQVRSPVVNDSPRTSSRFPPAESPRPTSLSGVNRRRYDKTNISPVTNGNSSPKRTELKTVSAIRTRTKQVPDVVNKDRTSQIVLEKKMLSARTTATTTTSSSYCSSTDKKYTIADSPRIPSSHTKHQPSDSTKSKITQKTFQSPRVSNLDEIIVKQQQEKTRVETSSKPRCSTPSPILPRTPYEKPLSSETSVVAPLGLENDRCYSTFSNELHQNLPSEKASNSSTLKPILKPSVSEPTAKLKYQQLRSCFSSDAVRPTITLVRPVLSNELKIFSCNLDEHDAIKKGDFIGENKDSGFNSITTNRKSTTAIVEDEPKSCTITATSTTNNTLNDCITSFLYDEEVNSSSEPLKTPPIRTKDTGLLFVEENLKRTNIIDTQYDKQIPPLKSESSSFVSGLIPDLSTDSLNGDKENETNDIDSLVIESDADNTDESLASSASRAKSTTTTSTTHTPLMTWSRIKSARSSCENSYDDIDRYSSSNKRYKFSSCSSRETIESERYSASPQMYDGHYRKRDVRVAADGRYFLLIDSNNNNDGSSSSIEHGNSDESRYKLNYDETIYPSGSLSPPLEQSGFQNKSDEVQICSQGAESYTAVIRKIPSVPPCSSSKKVTTVKVRATNQELSTTLIPDSNEISQIVRATPAQAILSPSTTDIKNRKPPAPLPLEISTDSHQSLNKKAERRLVFPSRLGRILFFRRVLSDSDIYQKLCSKENEIRHNVYHLDTIRDYSMEYYMLTTFGSDSQLRAWTDDYWETRFQHDYELNDEEEDYNTYNHITHSNDEEDDELESNQQMADDELDWYSEDLESFNISSQLMSMNSDDNVEEFLRSQQLSVSSLATSNESSSSAGFDVGVPSSWPISTAEKSRPDAKHSTTLTALDPCPLSHNDIPQTASVENTNIEEQRFILQEILNYSWGTQEAKSISSSISSTNDQSHEQHSTTKIKLNNQNDRKSSICSISDQVLNTMNTLEAVDTTNPSIEQNPYLKDDQFRTDFYYLCPLTRTSSFPKGSKEQDFTSNNTNDDAKMHQSNEQQTVNIRTTRQSYDL
ncbi:unnamed protein product [Didymodactylos carnosus]|uniref:Uncharacterized protein n=1 Tax=Didymodactylos carnosus TaxID=1234261 RepID=A0A814B4W7_9BILA|nr:unnamed protein product [Didymodactylos carnosus]CAF3702648.1 unnamed protein product [Didymodactylos carnosus]